MSLQAPMPVFVTVSVFAKLVSAKTPRVRKWIAEGMPSIRADRHWRVEVEPALAWLRAKGGSR